MSENPTPDAPNPDPAVTPTDPNAGTTPAPPTTGDPTAHVSDDPNVNATDEVEFYCPGCGRRYGYRRECTGHPTAPHAPIEVVSTDELKGDNPDDHTAAPNTDTAV